MLLGVVVFLGLAGLAVWAFIEAVKAEPAVVGSITTAVLGILGVVWQQQRSEQARLDEAHRARMTPTYDELLQMVNSMFGQGGDEEDEADGEPSPALVDFMKDLKGRQMILGASTETIRAFNGWQQKARQAQETEDSLLALEGWEDLLRAMRADLGHKDGSLPKWDLLRLYITDLDEYLVKESVNDQH